MAIQRKRFNWVRSATAWERIQGWRERRAAMREQFESASAALTNGISSVQTSQISGSVGLAVQTATKRVQSERQAKIAQLINKIA